jgi:hypothetical protein
MQSTQNSLLFTDLSEAAQESINGGISVSATVVGNGSVRKSIAMINGKEVSPEVFDAEFAKIQPKFDSTVFSGSSFRFSGFSSWGF